MARAVTARWVLPDPAERIRLGVPAPLRITAEVGKGEVSAVYYLTRDGDGWRLEHQDSGKAYDLPEDLSGCSCPDQKYRPGRACKHRAGLALALASP